MYLDCCKSSKNYLSSEYWEEYNFSGSDTHTTEPQDSNKSDSVSNSSTAEPIEKMDTPFKNVETSDQLSGSSAGIPDNEPTADTADDNSTAGAGATEKHIWEAPDHRLGMHIISALKESIGKKDIALEAKEWKEALASGDIGKYKERRMRRVENLNLRIDETEARNDSFQQTLDNHSGELKQYRDKFKRLEDKVDKLAFDMNQKFDILLAHLSSLKGVAASKLEFSLPTAEPMAASVSHDDSNVETDFSTASTESSEIESGFASSSDSEKSVESDSCPAASEKKLNTDTKKSLDDKTKVQTRSQFAKRYDLELLAATPEIDEFLAMTRAQKENAILSVHFKMMKEAAGEKTGQPVCPIEQQSRSEIMAYAENLGLGPKIAKFEHAMEYLKRNKSAKPFN